jgi:hypothetical protein
MRLRSKKPLPNGSYGRFRAHASGAQVRAAFRNNFPDKFRPAQTSRKTYARKTSPPPVRGARRS